ncbi:hypothetical protein PVAP13_9NG513000 [Panicum virgatum]|uniref:Uncharacterized protein n=1 Tax=Panicum virgatum TaxID=38727 RepID=A0A8T0MUM1_PANVG|nr:hypothetical protein PVAP13_9NG513000 [Panicum virgatum]
MLRGDSGGEASRGGSDCDAPCAPGRDPPLVGGAALPLPWRVLDRSTSISQREDALSVAVEVDLVGIPALAWEPGTAQLLMCDYCWISALHPRMADRRDVFRVAAWCSDPNLIPSEMVLEIVEPLPAVGSYTTMKRTLCYPITISVSPYVQPLSPGNPPSPAPGDDDCHGRRRRRLPPSPGSSVRRLLSSRPSNSGLRVSVQDRLGPNPATSPHEDSRD